MKQFLRQVPLIALPLVMLIPLKAADKTPENLKLAEYLAASGKTQNHWRALTSGHGPDLSFVFLEMGSRLFQLTDDSAEIILDKMGNRELKLLADFFATPAGSAFIAHQERAAVDLAPVVGREIARVASGSARTPVAQGARGLSAGKALFIQDMRPLVRALFEESFYDYKSILLDNLNSEDGSKVSAALNRFDLAALEEAYLESLGRHLSEGEAKAVVSFFSNADAVFAYKRLASCRRASTSRIFLRR